MDTKAKLTPEQEEHLIDEAYKHLLDGYLSSNHRKKVEIINRAFRFAKEAHSGIRRRSGEPYILHPIAVATIVSREIGLGSTSICAALLHDVVEDTEFTVEDLAAQFGPKIAQIVEGLTKISGGIFGDQASAQAENFRKLLLTMSSDIRVILIKMADRLHNMRTLESMPARKQYKIAGETLYIYAPLAHRLGLFAIKTELEDLSFKYEHPEAYAEIGHNIEATEQQRQDYFKRFAEPIRNRLDQLNLDYEFKVRVKSRYSIWRKMQTKHIPFEEVYDIYAARIVFECSDPQQEKLLCWTIYSQITDIYRLHPDRTRDWVSVPKANGYRALHLTVMGPEGNWVEIQIRSRHMDDIAERGFAAHWKYKIGEGEEETELSAWLQTIEDILKNPEPNAIDFLDTIKLNLFSSEIVVFTPKGELINLPKDATVLDMAFTLHSEIGMHCIAGKVNHKLVPISYRLSSGDQVEILTSRSQQPQAEWENFVVTAKGKSRLRQALRHTRRSVIDQGEKRLNDFIVQHQLQDNADLVTQLVSQEQVQNKEELLFKIGNGEIVLNPAQLKKNKTSRGFKRFFYNPFSSKKTTAEPIYKISDEEVDMKKVYVLRTENGIRNYKLAPCCNPIPGDAVLGYVNEQKEVIVHKTDCPKALQLESSFGGRIVQTRWEEKLVTFLATIYVEGVDRKGILQELIYLISTNMSINMRRLDIKANDGLFTCELDVLIPDADVVTRMCKSIKRIDGVTTASRTK